MSVGIWRDATVTGRDSRRLPPGVSASDSAAAMAGTGALLESNPPAQVSRKAYGPWWAALASRAHADIMIRVDRDARGRPSVSSQEPLELFGGERSGLSSQRVFLTVF